MTNLSPAAKAVLDAFFDADDSRVINGGDWVQDQESMVAAALRVAADQVVPATFFNVNGGDRTVWETKRKVRDYFLAIADELDGYE